MFLFRLVKLTQRECIEVNMKEDGKLCCECRHFRMWKPQEMYCTVKKNVVDPLKRNEPCHIKRKGLKNIF
jgi:hypothetical protein